MTDDLTPKQEKFTQVYIETGNASEAYRQAYNIGKMKPDTIHTAAQQLMDNYKVLGRIKELQAEHAERHRVTLDSLTEEYNVAKDTAYGLDQTSAAISAINGKAKIHGFDKTTLEVRLPRVVRKILTGKELSNE